jgi:hypothetical protein
MSLRPHADAALPILMKEAASLFPSSLEALAGWQPPWYRPGASLERTSAATEETPPAPSRVVLGPSERAAASLLAAQPAATEALAAALGLPASWSVAPAAAETDRPAAVGSPEHDAVRALLRAFPATVHAAASFSG